MTGPYGFDGEGFDSGAEASGAAAPPPPPPPPPPVNAWEASAVNAWEQPAAEAWEAPEGSEDPFVDASDEDAVYDDAVYEDAPVGDAPYAATDPDEAEYTDAGYAEPAYGEAAYAEPGYAEAGYGEVTYGEAAYAEPAYGEDGYGDEAGPDAAPAVAYGAYSEAATPEYTYDETPTAAYDVAAEPTVGAPYVPEAPLALELAFQEYDPAASSAYSYVAPEPYAPALPGGNGADAADDEALSVPAEVMGAFQYGGAVGGPPLVADTDPFDTPTIVAPMRVPPPVAAGGSGKGKLIALAAAVLLLLIGGIAFAATRQSSDDLATSATTAAPTSDGKGAKTTGTTGKPTVLTTPDGSPDPKATPAPTDSSVTDPAVIGDPGATVVGGGPTTPGPNTPSPTNPNSPPVTIAPPVAPSVSITTSKSTGVITANISAQNATSCVMSVAGRPPTPGNCNAITVGGLDPYYTSYNVFVTAINQNAAGSATTVSNTQVVTMDPLVVTVLERWTSPSCCTFWYLYPTPATNDVPQARLGHPNYFELRMGSRVSIKCQKDGPFNHGTTIWDLIDYQGTVAYIPDSFAAGEGWRQWVPRCP